MPEIKPIHKFTDAERAAMENLAMAMIRHVNENCSAMSKGAAIHATLVGCAAILQTFCPPGMSKLNHQQYTELAADTLIEQLLSMYGK